MDINHLHHHSILQMDNYSETPGFEDEEGAIVDTFVVNNTINWQIIYLSVAVHGLDTVIHYSKCDLGSFRR